ncbi:predicted protein [Histoplasma mississippiense (nom. inval.)]|uniref:predicted protein n=1 Tax=Ajellomyces capsulatus (strain NAm1 / WU24) TaxID=2059318 RepID=UPI000157BC32|nr:predicted protein [Histoplasma mississippiense (nom. inval.)]EDN05533.1 predicted protein [Histoplasma mississippiense (nom. inval.)]
MAASFHLRYIPPRDDSAPSHSKTLASPAAFEKRKRKHDPAYDAPIPPSIPSKKARKHERDENPEASGADPQSHLAAARRQDTYSHSYSKAESNISPAAEGQEHVQINSLMGGQENKDLKQGNHRASTPYSAPKVSTDLSHRSELSGKLDRKDDDVWTKIAPEKHAGVLSKFEKSTLKSTSAAPKKSQSNMIGDRGTENITPHGLEPLPQPASSPLDIESPTYSTLPAWLTQPFAAATLSERNFSNLGVNKTLVSVLERRGYTEAFPIQAAVLELLGTGKHRHSGDLCISATTGSGKTLAYALPLVAGIEHSSYPRLRGLVVVPTRELVWQAREACELCATGTGLRIGTAVGTASLNEEQASLIKHEQFYSPRTDQIKNIQQMSADAWTSFNIQEYISEAENSPSAFPNHVAIPSPSVDILICTPGRLVQHIKSTKGFTLGHLEWLVIDEADRLLNESFQEWVEVVIPALDRNRIDVNAKSGGVLQELGWKTCKPRLQKIILSATMTRDISKLQALRLRNPKLVVSDDPRISNVAKITSEAHGDIIKKDDHKFSLPSTLREMFVPVGDAAEKPLYLLTLLLSHFKLGGANSASLPRSRSHSITSDSNSTSSASKALEDSLLDASSTASHNPSDTDSSEQSAADVHNFKPMAASASVSSVLIFARSSESASRLARLLSLMHPPFANRIGTLTKSNKSSTSRKTLSAFRNGKLSIVIATDRASRGLDLPSLTHVVSYDIPTSLTSYIHRVGRTARAGRSGSAWTLVAHSEGRWFANEVVKCGKYGVSRVGTVERVIVKLDEKNSHLKKKYSDALGLLQIEVKGTQAKHR